MIPEVCPRCKDGDMLGLVDPAEEDVYGLDASEYDEDAEVWHCAACGWAEQADEEDAIEYHTANLVWALGKIEGLK